jgi:hypothetical protein
MDARLAFDATAAGSFSASSKLSQAPQAGHFPSHFMLFVPHSRQMYDTLLFIAFSDNRFFLSSYHKLAVISSALKA